VPDLVTEFPEGLNQFHQILEARSEPLLGMAGYFFWVADQIPTSKGTTNLSRDEVSPSIEGADADHTGHGP